MIRVTQAWAGARAAVLALLAVAFAGPVAAQGMAALRIGGTGSATGGMQLVAEAYTKAHPGRAVTVLPALGSAGGIQALRAGKLDIALSNREPNEAEREGAALNAVTYASTPFVVAVHRDLGVTSMSGKALAALFEPGATYANGQRARPVLRRGDAGDTRLLQSMAPELVAAVDAAGTRRGMLDAATDSDAADLVQNTPGAFASSTLAQLQSERRPLVALVLDGREPSVDALAAGRYPFKKRLIAITAATPSEATRHFMTYLRSPAAQALLRANGHLPE